MLTPEMRLVLSYLNMPKPAQPFCHVCKSTPTSAGYHYRTCERRLCSIKIIDQDSRIPGAVKDVILRRLTDANRFYCPQIGCAFSTCDADKMVAHPSTCSGREASVLLHHPSTCTEPLRTGCQGFPEKKCCESSLWYHHIRSLKPFEQMQPEANIAPSPIQPDIGQYLPTASHCNRF